MTDSVHFAAQAEQCRQQALAEADDLRAEDLFALSATFRRMAWEMSVREKRRTGIAHPRTRRRLNRWWSRLRKPRAMS